MSDVDDARPPLHVFHIGKTGGTALNQTLLKYADASSYRLVFGGHTLTLRDVPAGEPFMFVLRDPLTRFVSAFNGRLREDRPRYHYPWREEEKTAFAIFKTPDQLATALSSADDDERMHAEDAMQGIGHVNTPYSYWFGDEDVQQVVRRLVVGVEEHDPFRCCARKPPSPRRVADDLDVDVVRPCCQMLRAVFTRLVGCDDGNTCRTP